MEKENTPGVGAEYEIVVPAYFALAFNKNPKIQDFTLRTNVPGFGNLDDVVIDVQTNNREYHFAFQLKHKERTRKNVSPASFEAKNSNLFLEKYCTSFKDIKNEHRKYYHFILYTNQKFDKNRKGEVSKFTMKHDKKFAWKNSFNTSCNNKNIYRFQVNPQTTDGSVTSADYKQFLSQFSLYTNQKNFREFRKKISKMLKNENAVPAYIELFRGWHQGIFTNKTIDKKTINIHLIHIFLSPYALTTYHLSTGHHENLELFEDATKNFDVTIIADSKTQFIRNLENCETTENLGQLWIDKIKNLLEHYMNKYEIIQDDINEALAQTVLRLAKEYKIVDKTMTKLEEDLKMKMLCYFFEKPLIVDLDTSEELTYTALELYQKETGIKFVLVGTQIDLQKFNKFRLFTNLGNLRINSCLYTEMIRTCTLSLQGRDKVSLEQLLNLSDKVNEITGTKEVYKMLKPLFVVGKICEELPKHRMKRIVSTTTLDIREVFDHSPQEIMIINCDKENQQYEDLIKNRRTQTPIIMLTDEAWSIEKFEEICQKNMDRNVHYLKIVNANFLLVMSTRNTFKSQNLQRKQLTIDEQDIHSYFNNPVQIVCGQPGMGKTTIFNYLTSTTPSEFWVIRVDLKTHNLFLKENSNSHDILNRFLSQDNQDNYLRELRKLFLENKKLIIFLDGLDELETSCVDNILHFIKSSSRLGHRIWISSRQHLQDRLEEELGIFGIELDELRREQQEQYVRDRLRPEYNEGEIENMVEHIFESTDVTRNREVLAIPLQIYIITQIFLDDKQRYKNSNKNDFVLTKMYTFFFQGRYKHAYEKTESKHNHLKIGESQDHLDKYEIAALQSLFAKDIFDALKLDIRINERFMKTIAKDKDPLGIIVKLNDQDKPVFEHFTFAEYFACVYLSNNFDKFRILQKHLLSEKYQNLMLILNILLAEDNPLHLAVIYKDVEQVKEYLDDVNIYDKGKRNPLHVACFSSISHPYLQNVATSSRYIIDKTEARCFFDEREYSNHRTIVNQLLKFDPFESDKLFEWNCLDYSFAFGCLYVSEAILKEYSESTEPDKTLQRYSDNPSIPFYATFLMYPNLLAKMMDINKLKFSKTIDVHGYNLLDFSIFRLIMPLVSKQRRKNLEIIKLLLNHDLLVHVKTIFVDYMRYRSKKMIRIVLNKHEVCNITAEGEQHNYEKLLKNSNINAVNTKGETLLHYAITKKNQSLVTFLVDNGANIEAVTKCGNNTLHYAAKWGNTKIIELLADEGVDFNARNSIGETPLDRAVKNKHIEAVDMLIQKGTNNKNSALHSATFLGELDIINLLLNSETDINAHNKKGETTLHYAILGRKIDALKLLLKRHANPHAITRNKKTILHYAVETNNIDLVNECLNTEVSVDAKNNRQETALNIAVEKGNIQIVRALLEKDADPNNIAKNNTTMLHYAVCNETTEVIELILNEDAINAKTLDGNTPLHVAVQKGRLDSVKYLLEKGAKADEFAAKGTPLHYAAQNGNIQILDILLRKTVDVNARNANNETPLHLAAIKGHLKAVQLLSEKADCSVRSSDGSTILHYAAINGNVDIVRLLIREKIDVKATNGKGETALHFALRGERDEIIQLLIKNGANFQAVTNDGDTAMHYLFQGDTTVSSNIVKKIMKYVDPNIKNKNGKTALDVAVENKKYGTVAFLMYIFDKSHCSRLLINAARDGDVTLFNILLNQCSNVNSKNEEGRTALYQAVEGGHSCFVMNLIQHGADPNETSSEQIPILHFAALKGNINIVCMLLLKGANYTATTADGSTPLHSAARSGNVEIIDIFLHKDIDVDVKNKNGETPLHLAVQDGHHEATKFLLDKSASVDALTNDNLHALHFAVYNKDCKMIKLLLERELDFDKIDWRNDKIPLSFAIVDGRLQPDLLLHTN